MATTADLGQRAEKIVNKSLCIRADVLTLSRQFIYHEHPSVEKPLRVKNLHALLLWENETMGLLPDA